MSGAGEFIWKVYRTFIDPTVLLYEHCLLAWLDASELSFAMPASVPARSGETLFRIEYAPPIQSTKAAFDFPVVRLHDKPTDPHIVKYKTSTSRVQ